MLLLAILAIKHENKTQCFESCDLSNANSQQRANTSRILHWNLFNNARNLQHDQQLYLTAGMPTRSHSPLEVYLPRSPDELRFTRSIWWPLYVHEPNLSGQRCSSNGKNVTSMRHELFVIAGTTHNTVCWNVISFDAGIIHTSYDISNVEGSESRISIN